MIKYEQYLIRYTARKLQQLKSSQPTQSSDLVLPLDVCIHYISDNLKEYGIRHSHPLLQASKAPVRVSHVLDLVIMSGRPSRRQFNVEAVLLAYFKGRPTQFTRVRKRIRTLKEARSIFIVDYSLLPHTHRYTGKRAFWDQQANLQASLWSGLKQIGTERQNLIPLKLPEVLPPYRLFKKTPVEIPAGYLSQWEDVDSLALKAIWDLLETREALSMTLARHITLVFIESGQLIQVNLGLLYEWAEDNLETARRALYAAWVNLIEVRTGVETEALADIPPAKIPPGKETVVGAVSLTRSIKELVDAGRLSTAEQKRLWTLSESYKTIPNPVGKGTLETLIKVDKKALVMDNLKPSIVDIPGVVDKTMLRSTVDTFTSQYVKSVMESDIAAMTLSLQKGGILVKDYKVSEHIDALNDFKVYKVTIQPINGLQSTLTFKVPTIQPNGEFRVNGTNKRLDNQRADLPIRKVASDKVALTSYYGKVFISRSPKASANYSRWIISLLSRLSMSGESEDFGQLVFSTSPLPKIPTPRGYSAVAVGIESFNVGNYRFNFNYHQRIALLGDLVPAVEAQVGGIACGAIKGKPRSLLVMDWDNNLFQADGQTPPILIGSLPQLLDPAAGEGPIEYIDVRVYGKAIPLAVVLSYHLGINQLLSDLKIPHRWVEAGKALNLNEDEIRIRFKDESLVYDRRHRQGSLILGGFISWKRATVKIAASDMNNAGSFGFLFDLMTIGRHVIKELNLMERMFIDPITESLLTDMKEPTDLIGLYYRASELLMDDSYTDEMDSSQMRIRGYERISGMVYHRLVNAVREQRNSETPKRNKVDIPARAIWGDIINDTSIVLVEESNPVHNLKEKEGLTFTGQGGRTARTMVGKSRLFHPNDIGTVSEATPDSQKVAIKTYLTPNAKLNSVRGTSSRYDKSTDGLNSLLSTTAILSPGTLHMDPKRVNMGSVQQGSMVGAVGSTLSPLRTGYEQVVAVRTDDRFAYNAKGPGKITEVSEDYLSIEYTDADGVKQSTAIKLGVVHGKASGATIPHQVITDLPVGHRFKPDDILAWNPIYFSRDYLNPRGVSLHGGVLARVAFMENPDTLEDSSAISSELSQKLATPVTLARTFIIDFSQSISDLVKVGDTVNIDSVLLSIEEGVIEDSTSDISIATLSKITSHVPRAKAKGVISKIETVYIGDIKAMHPSLAKWVRKDNRQRAEAAKRIPRTAKTGEITEKTFVNKEQLTENTVAITIYIDKLAPAGIGDKYVLDMATKSVAGRIFTGTNTTEDGQAIDMTFGYMSISNRMVGSSLVNGVVNTALLALTQQVIEAYRS